MSENGYFDLQVNGYAGVDFNSDALTPEDLHRACLALQAHGVAEILATIITEDIEVMSRRLTRLVDLRAKDPLAERLIAGVHIEGPFINPAEGYRGAHPADAICPADTNKMNRLLDAAGGLTRIVTLAPECDPNLTVTRLLVGSGVVVSAGHCDTALEQLAEAIDAGLSMFTHLGNGCPMSMPRHDNIIQRALALSGRLWLMLIADGVHLPFFVLKNILAVAGVERCIVTTDAMAAAGLGPGRYSLGRWELLIGEDLAARSHDGKHLVGSAMSMPQAEANLREHLDLSDEQIRRLTIENPRRAVGLQSDIP